MGPESSRSPQEKQQRLEGDIINLLLTGAFKVGIFT